MKNKVIIYSTPTCAYCYTVKDYLKEKGVEYKEINIETNPTEKTKMEKISGQKNVPVTIINGKIVIGWDKKQINNLLNI